MTRAALLVGCLAVLACRRTSGPILAPAHVTAIGPLGDSSPGAKAEGIEITYDECPNVTEQIAFDSLGPTSPAMPATNVACLRGLGVGARVDMKVTTSRNLQTAAYSLVAVGSCELPKDFEMRTRVQGDKRCAWMR